MPLLTERETSGNRSYKHIAPPEQEPSILTMTTFVQSPSLRLCTKSRKDTTGFAPWSFMCAAMRIPRSRSEDATGWPRGASRSLLFSQKREPPRPKAVASSFAGWQNRCSVQREDSTGQARGIFDFYQSRFASSIQLTPVTSNNHSRNSSPPYSIHIEGYFEW